MQTKILTSTYFQLHEFWKHTGWQIEWAASFMKDDAAEAEWFSITDPPSYLAFDHKLIVRTAFEHLLKQDEAQRTGKHQAKAKEITE